MRKFRRIIDDAPRKDLIPLIIQEKSLKNFHQFHKARKKWYGYPLIHDICFTVGLYQDLIDVFPKDATTINTFINFSIQISTNENDKNFLCAIFLLENFCSLGTEKCHPSPNQISQIISLYPKVLRLIKEPNMSCFWQQILNYCAKDPTFDRTKYQISD